MEHSRIYIFGTHDRDKIYIASADFMTRNTLRRVEVAAPLYDETVKCKVRKLFATMLRDNVKAREQQPDGSYRKITTVEPVLNSQEFFYEEAYKEAGDAIRQILRQAGDGDGKAKNRIEMRRRSGYNKSKQIGKTGVIAEMKIVFFLDRKTIGF